MDIGGIIHGEWEYSDESGMDKSNRRAISIAWGTVTQDVKPIVQHTKKGETLMLKFRVRLKKHVFLRCTVRHNCKFFQAASVLKKNEMIIMLGEMAIWTYETKKGERKIAHDFYPQIVLPGSMVLEPLIYADRMAGDADPLFSQEDEIDEEFGDTGGDDPYQPVGAYGPLR